jgi:hypothetical protein
MEVRINEIIKDIVEYARYLNFPKKVRQGSLLRTMHGTEYLHGFLEKGLISNNLYEQLKRLAEDPELEYNIELE